MYKTTLLNWKKMGETQYWLYYMYYMYNIYNIVLYVQYDCTILQASTSNIWQYLLKLVLYISISSSSHVLPMMYGRIPDTAEAGKSYSGFLRENFSFGYTSWAD